MIQIFFVCLLVILAFVDWSCFFLIVAGSRCFSESLDNLAIGEALLLNPRLLLPCLSIFSDRNLAISGGIVLLLQIPRYFPLLGSFSTRLDSRDLMNNLPTFPWISHCSTLPLS